MALDAKEIDGGRIKADEFKKALDALNGSVTPNIDKASIESAHVALRAFLADLQRAGSLVGSLKACTPASIPGLGKTQRGSFSFGGVQGE